MWARSRRTEDLSVIRPMRLFHSSNLYLSLLFVAVALDPLLAAPLRTGEPAVLGRVERGKLLLDLRCVPSGQDEAVLTAVLHAAAVSRAAPR